MTATTVVPGQAAVAARLRELAQALDALAARGTSGFSVSVYVRPGLDVYLRADQVAMVDALAGQLGLVAAPVKSAAGWSHEARVETGGVRVVVTAYIDAPAQRCVCGAVCTHGSVT